MLGCAFNLRRDVAKIRRSRKRFAANAVRRRIAAGKSAPDICAAQGKCTVAAATRK